MTGKGIKVFAIAALVGAAAGCAHEHPELRSQIDSANSAAQSAQQSANRAQQTADRAMKAAQDAKSEAREAQECCQANSRRIERAFESSQRK